MAICLNKERSTGEYQTKLKQSGISQFRFDVFVSNFKERHGRYPELDEIPGADSENYIIESLGIKKEGDFNMIAKEDLMNKLGVESTQQAQIKLNNIYRDKEITVVPLVDSCIVNIKNRPSKYGESSKMSVELQNIFDTAPDAPASIVLSTIVEGLSDKYGIGIRTITTSELKNDKWKGVVQDPNNTKAFIYNGDIYINTDNATIDSPVHEMLHLILGSLKYSNNDLYNSLVQSMESIPDYRIRIKEFTNRSISDINEEIFVTEFSKYLTGQDTILKNLDSNTLYEIFYNMNRVLDSAIFGKDSVSKLSPNEEFNSSLADLCKKLQSTITKNTSTGTFDRYSSEVKRIMSNEKADLMREGKLKEICN